MKKGEKKPKPGKVIRVDPVVWKLLSAKREPKETITAVLRRLLALPGRKGEKPKQYYILPSDLTETISEARGRAIVMAVRRKTKPEKPIAVRLEA